MVVVVTVIWNALGIVFAREAGARCLKIKYCLYLVNNFRARAGPFGRFTERRARPYNFHHFFSSN